MSKYDPIEILWNLVNLVDNGNIDPFATLCHQENLLSFTMMYLEKGICK